MMRILKVTLLFLFGIVYLEISLKNLPEKTFVNKKLPGIILVSIACFLFMQFFGNKNVYRAVRNSQHFLLRICEEVELTSAIN